MSKKILIVDDSVTMRQMVGMTLRKAGFEVLEGANGQEGLQALEHEQVVLVISDVNMPIMDGISMARAIRQLPAYRLTPILLLTTEIEDTKKQAARAAGATGWMKKPFQPEHLLTVVAKVLATQADPRPV
jgi:two-component system, chemotaxis family, chemotaxis protein CheY